MMQFLGAFRRKAKALRILIQGKKEARGGGGMWTVKGNNATKATRCMGDRILEQRQKKKGFYPLETRDQGPLMWARVSKAS